MGIFFIPNFPHPLPTSLILGLFSFHEHFKNAASSSLRQDILKHGVVKLTTFPLRTLIRFDIIEAFANNINYEEESKCHI